jgi:putative membrane protein
MEKDTAAHVGRDPAILDDPTTLLASNRTAMSFERTAMSSDRTLMSVIRTSLSLLGFGFTIFQFFHTLNERFMEGRLPTEAPRRFGGALVVLGITLLALGIFNHLNETRARRRRRARLYEGGLVAHVEPVKASSAMVIAILLLMVGLLAFVSIAFRVGPL